MQIRNIIVATTLLVVVGGAFSYSRFQKSQVVPLSPSEQKRSRCEIHGVALQTETVPITYGLVEFQNGYLQARRRQFPNANSAALGGCVVSKDSPRLQTVKFCPQCRTAEKRWGQAHSNPPISNE